MKKMFLTLVMAVAGLAQDNYNIKDGTTMAFFIKGKTYETYINIDTINDCKKIKGCSKLEGDELIKCNKDCEDKILPPPSGIKLENPSEPVNNTD